jgi:hypothetical protein
MELSCPDPANRWKPKFFHYSTTTFFQVISITGTHLLLQCAEFLYSASSSSNQQLRHARIAHGISRLEVVHWITVDNIGACATAWGHCQTSNTPVSHGSANRHAHLTQCLRAWLLHNCFCVSEAQICMCLYKHVCINALKIGVICMYLCRCAWFVRKFTRSCACVRTHRTNYEYLLRLVFV